MILNLNIGVLGHVDSGKTTLAKVISQISSTAAFDKNPQSQERGITLDLGFSAYTCDMPEHLLCQNSSVYDKLQFTFVDCPGHAKLIRTIIGGAQIIDLMLLVVDITKGIQTQTAECLVIGELTCRRLIVILNKIDLLDATKKSKTIEKVTKKIHTLLRDTPFGDAVVHPLSATTNENVDEFIEILKSNSFLPQRDTRLPFVFAVDHCFSIKGSGTICTGTVLQGRVKVNDAIEIGHAKELRKIKSIQMFRQPMNDAQQGDRIGICITQFDPQTLERGIIAAPNYLLNIKAAVIPMNVIKYYKGSIRSKSKFHINIGHEMTMANITLFRSPDGGVSNFNAANEYEYQEFLEHPSVENDDDSAATTFCLLEFEKNISIIPGALAIAAKLDMDVGTTQCRLAFWGKLNPDTTVEWRQPIQHFKIFKRKIKEGTIQRVVNEREIIVDHLFKKESNRQLFVGFRIELTSGETGFIESTFGSTSKVKVRLLDGLTSATFDRLKQRDAKDVKVVLKFKKYLYDKNKITSTYERSFINSSNGDQTVT